MSDAVVRPRMKGFIGLDAHPGGCARVVSSMVDALADPARIEAGAGEERRGPVVVVGSSGGYGLPCAVVAAFRYGLPVLGVCLERPAQRNRTGSAGWYSVGELHRRARAAGVPLETVNADCFADETKDIVLKRLREWGSPSLLIHSVASPLRVDPETGIRHRSTLHPVGEPFTTKTIKIDNGEVGETSIEPATDDEVASTVKVMGGEDWERWIDALDAEGLIEDGFGTVAFSYIGPEVTHPIYRSGSIGAAKAHLEETAHRLHDRLGDRGGAWVSVNAAAVTQSAVAIPAVPLYLSLLLRVTVPTGTFEDPAEQMRRLFDDHLLAPGGPTVDGERRIRLDDWELADEVQAEVGRRWAEVTTETLDELGDFSDFRRRFRQLFGFDVDGIDYEQPVAIDVPLTG
jgi:enoyl-[acyl-carrier protein] reductase / trans-2-enoyl-CoA reductase (NAD+)